MTLEQILLSNDAPPTEDIQHCITTLKGRSTAEEKLTALQRLITTFPGHEAEIISAFGLRTVNAIKGPRMTRLRVLCRLIDLSPVHVHRLLPKRDVALFKIVDEYTKALMTIQRIANTQEREAPAIVHIVNTKVQQAVAIAASHLAELQPDSEDQPPRTRRLKQTQQWHRILHKLTQAYPGYAYEIIEILDPDLIKVGKELVKLLNATAIMAHQNHLQRLLGALDFDSKTCISVGMVHEHLNRLHSSAGRGYVEVNNVIRQLDTTIISQLEPADKPNAFVAMVHACLYLDPTDTSPRAPFVLQHMHSFAARELLAIVEATDKLNFLKNLIALCNKLFKKPASLFPGRVFLPLQQQHHMFNLHMICKCGTEIIEATSDLDEKKAILHAFVELCPVHTFGIIHRFGSSMLEQATNAAEQKTMFEDFIGLCPTLGFRCMPTSDQRCYLDADQVSVDRIYQMIKIYGQPMLEAAQRRNTRLAIVLKFAGICPSKTMPIIWRFTPMLPSQENAAEDMMHILKQLIRYHREHTPDIVESFCLTVLDAVQDLSDKLTLLQQLVKLSPISTYKIIHQFGKRALVEAQSYEDKFEILQSLVDMYPTHTVQMITDTDLGIIVFDAAPEFDKQRDLLQHWVEKTPKADDKFEIIKFYAPRLFKLPFHFAESALSGIIGNLQIDTINEYCRCIRKLANSCKTYYDRIFFEYSALLKYETSTTTHSASMSGGGGGGGAHTCDTKHGTAVALQ